MKVAYRGHDIEVRRETPGCEILTYSVFRQDDGYEVSSGYRDSGQTVREMLHELKTYTVDEGIESGRTYDATDLAARAKRAELRESRTFTLHQLRYKNRCYVLKQPLECIARLEDPEDTEYADWEAYCPLLDHTEFYDTRKEALETFAEDLGWMFWRFLDNPKWAQEDSTSFRPRSEAYWRKLLTPLVFATLVLDEGVPPGVAILQSGTSPPMVMTGLGEEPVRWVDAELQPADITARDVLADAGERGTPDASPET